MIHSHNLNAPFAEITRDGSQRTISSVVRESSDAAAARRETSLVDKASAALSIAEAAINEVLRTGVAAPTPVLLEQISAEVTSLVSGWYGPRLPGTFSFLALHSI